MGTPTRISFYQPCRNSSRFIEDDGTTISTSQAIAEYLEETSKEPALIFGTALQRAEIRRLCNWFDVKFNTEVTEYLLGEKIMKRFLGLEPSSETIRAGYANIDTHLGYIEYLAEQRAWLAGDNFSLADITAITHFCIDYLGDIAWEDYQQAKQWYARIKSRPSFRPLLQDLIPGTQPPAHYKNLDFSKYCDTFTVHPFRKHFLKLAMFYDVFFCFWYLYAVLATLAK